MDKPLPTTIPISRALLMITVIFTSSALLTWQLTYSAGKQSFDFAYSTLFRQSEVLCKWPKFSPFDVSQMKNSSFIRTIECPSIQPSFATLDSDGFLIIVPPLSSIRDYSSVKCSYSSLSINSSNNIHLDRPIPIQLNSRFRAKDEQFVVRCSNANGEIIYEEAFVNMKARFESSRLSVEETLGEGFTGSNESSPSLSILLLDPLSRSQFARQFPKTLKLMTQSDFFVPSRYSQYFTSPELNIDLLLNGEDKKNLMDVMADRGCLTFINEEPKSENDSSSLLSSSRPNFSIRPYHLFNKQKQQNEHCLSNGKSRIRSILSPLVDFSSSFSSICHFSLTRLRSPSQSSLIASIDDHLSDILYRFLSSPASERTTLFIVSPSGKNDGGLVGEVEGKTPMMASWFPLSFRKLRNPNYSTFSYNMDKLFTTRDVRETLVNIANGTYEEAHKIDPDMEQSESTSLLVEQLPESRNCSMVNIPEDNCMCMGTDERRNETINKDFILFDRVYDLLSSRILQESCIQSTEIKKNGHFLDSHQLNSTIYGTEGDEVEWLTIRFYAQLVDSARSSSQFITVEGNVRHYISSSRLEYVDLIVLNSSECLAVKVEQMCSMCYINRGAPVLSTDGATSGFLVDITYDSL